MKKEERRRLRSHEGGEAWRFRRAAKRLPHLPTVPLPTVRPGVNFMFTQSECENN
jgi:hypothetical protein